MSKELLDETSQSDGAVSIEVLLKLIESSRFGDFFLYMYCICTVKGIV